MKTGQKIAELEAEIERLKAAINSKPKPRARDQMEFSDLYSACSDYIDGIVNGYVDDDAEHWIFEAAMNTVYGEDVWDWIDEQLV